MSGTVDSWPEYNVSVTYQGECGDIQTYTFTFEMEEPTTPQLPSSPPITLQNLCMFDFEPSCYDFRNFGDECFESLEVETSSPKLIAEVNGTELCLSYIHPGPFTGSITVTPISSCGAGDPVTWTITANQPKHCDGDGFGGPRSVEQEVNYSIFPNPFRDQITISSNMQFSSSHTLEVYDMIGNRIYKQNCQNQTLNTVDWNSGVYLLKITSESNEIIQTEKFTKI